MIKKTDTRIVFGLSREDEKIIHQAAELDGRNISSFVRFAAIKEARVILSKINNR